MFTGLVETRGVVRDVVPEPPGARLTIDPAPIPWQIALGSSVAINGCCLTVVAAEPSGWTFSAGPETLSRTNLGQLQTGSQVNLERSLKVGDPLGGHFVTGHVDAVGQVVQRDDHGQWAALWCSYPRSLGSQLASKGSIAVDGVSLTLVDVEPTRFSVQLIPHTLASTTLGQRRVGDQMNLETDLLAKYIHAHMEFLGRGTP